MKAALRSWPIFDRAGFDVRVLSMPPGEDPDSLLRTGDRSAFVGLVQGAQPIPDYRIGLVMSEADLNTDAGRSSALRSAAVVIAEVESPLERERLVRVLSKYHPNFATGTVLAEDHIRAEVARERYRIKGTKQPGNAPQPAETGPAPQRQTFVERAEKQLLGILIVHGGDASKVLETLPPNQFMGQAARSLAEALSKHLAELGKIDLERLRSEVIGTPGEETLTDILLEADAPELNQPVEDLLNSILSRRNFERSLRYRELAHKIQEGSIAQGSEEFEEYWRLAKERQGGFGRGR
jgi:DNA primase